MGYISTLQIFQQVKECDECHARFNEQNTQHICMQAGCKKNVLCGKCFKPHMAREHKIEMQADENEKK